MYYYRWALIFLVTINTANIILGACCGTAVDAVAPTPIDYKFMLFKTALNGLNLGPVGAGKDSLQDLVDEQLAPCRPYVNTSDRFGSRPLHYVARGDGPSYELIATWLIKNGAEVNALEPLCGGTPLHGAAACCNPELTSLLLKQGADRSIENTKGQTPLNCALASSGEPTRKEATITALRDL